MDMPLNSGTRYASEYPLPGGVEKYFDTLVNLLRYLRDNKATFDDISQWIFATFPNASGQIAVNGYIATLGRLDLWSEQDGFCRLTPDGAALVRDAESSPAEARRLVLDIKCRVFSGYDLLVTLLSQGPHTLDDLHEYLKRALDVDWKTKNQTSFRVNWLRSLGYVVTRAMDLRETPL